MKHKLLRTRTSFVLSKTEMYFLQLLVHNCNYSAISEFLELPKGDLMMLYNRILIKTNKENTYNLIECVFKYSMLKRYDYIDDLIKQEASLTATEIFDHANSEVYELDVDYFKAMINKFIANSESRLLRKYAKLKLANKISAKEIGLINQKHQEFCHGDIKENLILFKNRPQTIEDIIQNKLNANCWYSALRIAFQMQLLYREDFNPIDTEIQVLKTSNKINEIKQLKGEDFFKNEKVYLIYMTLLEFYQGIEHKTLFEKVVYT